jgi:hypothetical protein
MALGLASARRSNPLWVAMGIVGIGEAILRRVEARKEKPAQDPAPVFDETQTYYFLFVMFEFLGGFGFGLGLVHSSIRMVRRRVNSI